MKRYTCPLLAAIFLFTASPASAGEVSERDRFELWNKCLPTFLVVEGVDKNAAEIGLTEDAIEVAVRSRLRGARLYTEDDAAGAGWSFLYVRVTVAQWGGATA